MKLSDWIVGPQLPGFIIGVMGLIQIYFPPKSINGIDLYMTSSPEKNKQILAEVKLFIPRLMMKIGVVLFIAGIIITAILRFTVTSIQLREGLTYMFVILSLPFTGPMIMTKTGKHLEKKFNNKDEIR